MFEMALMTISKNSKIISFTPLFRRNHTKKPQQLHRSLVFVFWNSHESEISASNASFSKMGANQDGLNGNGLYKPRNLATDFNGSTIFIRNKDQAFDKPPSPLPPSNYSRKSYQRNLKSFNWRPIGSALAIITCVWLLFRFGSRIVEDERLKVDWQAHSENLDRAWTDASLRLYLLWSWIRVPPIAYHILLSLAVTIFSVTIIYIDSDLPGVVPPTPNISLSPRKNRTGYQEHLQSSFSLGYLFATLSGLICFAWLRNN